MSPARRDVGAVRGLRAQVNDWLCEHVQDDILLGAVPAAPIPLMVASDKYRLDQLGPGPHFPDGNIDYHLLYRRGMLAVWQIDRLDLIAWEPELDIALCWGLDDNLLQGFTNGPEISAGTGCEPECDLLIRTSVWWADLKFLTFAIPWERNRVRGDVVDWCVACWSAPYDQTESDTWTWALDLVSPEQSCWCDEIMDDVRPTESYAAAAADNYWSYGGGMR